MPLISSGSLDKRVTFRRRGKTENPRERGPFADLVTMWGNYLRLSGREALQAGRETNVEEGTLRVRTPGLADDISIGDRVVIEGRERAITSVGTPERKLGFIEFTVKTDVKS